MKSMTKLQTALATAALMCCSGAFAANMAHADYSAAKDKIAAQYKSEKEACSSQAGNAKDVCVEQAKGRESVAKAQLEYSYTGKPADGVKVGEAQADANYAVAKEMCDDKGGKPKDVCVAEAKAAHTKAMADAKLAKKVDAARTDAMDSKMSADMKVAREKCDALAGNAKSACVDSAKAQYQK